MPSEPSGLQPENKSIYVLSRDGSYTAQDDLMWVQYCTTHQGQHSAIVAEQNDDYFGTTWRQQDPHAGYHSAHACPGKSRE